MPSVHFHVFYRCPVSWWRGRAGGRILTPSGSQIIESLLGPSSNRHQVMDVNDKSMTGTTLMSTPHTEPTPNTGSLFDS